MQSGFRKSHSTTTALLDVVDNILSAQDMGQGTLMALLDFSRAFDAINTKLLLSKMSYYGFETDAIAWFSSYLSDRTQVVQLQDDNGLYIKSKPSAVSRGVPQGSILGPLIFIMYTADVRDVIKHCHFHLYADDIQVYVSCYPSDTSQAVANLNEDLENITAWSESNCLVLNPSKTKYMLFGSKNQIKLIDSHNPVVSVMGDQVERISESRNLGIIMDEALRFESYISEVARTSFYRLKILYRIREFISVDLRIKLCDSLVLSRFNYADVVYGPRLLARTDRIVQRVQNACARYCFGIPPRTHVTPYLNSAGILKMAFRRELHLSFLLFGILKTSVPEYLFKKVTWRKNSSTVYGLRSISQNFIIPHHHTTAFRGSFKYTATKCWNNIPPPLKNINCLSSFKLKLKRHLLQIQKTLPLGGRVLASYL